ncbi:septum site-determining protein MinD [Bacillus tianshenii]|nr:septum site-determining protein MinD [Bacillus tianshenii]
MARIITITSGKGGVGKTTITANLGTSLALMDKKVCLIDADFGLCNLDLLLGLKERVIFDIGDYFNGDCTLDNILVKDKRLSNLHFIPGFKEYSNTEIAPDALKRLISELEDGYDYLLIDSPGGIEQGFQNAVTAAEEAIVVTTPEKTALQDADRIVGMLDEQLETSPLLIINRYCEKETQFTVEDIISLLNIELLEVIPEDAEIMKSIHHQVPIALDTRQENGLRFRHIARNLLTDKLHLFVSRKQTGKQSFHVPVIKKVMKHLKISSL